MKSMPHSWRGSGWSHHPGVKGTADAEASKLAIDFIRLLDDDLRARGYRLLAGMEMEASSGLAVPTDEAIAARLNTQTSLGHDAQGNALPNHHTRRAYLDVSQLEVTTPPLPPLQAAFVARNMKRDLVRGYDGETSTRYAQRVASVPSRRGKGGMYDRPMSFYRRDVATPYGEHINISLHHSVPPEAQDFDLGAHNLVAQEDWRSLLYNWVGRFALHEPQLFHGGELTERRLARGGFHEIDYKDKDKRNQSVSSAEARIELRVPDATSNPFLTMLATTAIVHHVVGMVDHYEKKLLPGEVADMAMLNAENRFAKTIHKAAFDALKGDATTPVFEHLRAFIEQKFADDSVAKSQWAEKLECFHRAVQQRHVVLQNQTER